MGRVKRAATVFFVAAVVPVSLQAQARAASLVGNVRDSSGAPVPLAQLFVSGVRVVADSAGHFVFVSLPAGAATLNVRRIGFEPRDVAIELVDGRTDSLLVLLTFLPQALPGVTTEGNAFARQRLADFHRHRESQMGYYLDRKQIEARQVTRLSDVLRRLPGVRLVLDRAGRYEVRMRGNAAGRDCPPDYWIDGVRAPALNVDDLPLSDIEALEVYRGQATVPTEYMSRLGNPACGAVVIWTRPPG